MKYNETACRGGCGPALVAGVLFAVGMVGLSPEAEATSIRVSQESSAGAGDFDTNVLGFIDAFSTGLTTAGFYDFSGASYNGHLHGGPPAVSNLSQLFLLDASDGLSLVVVYDGVVDGTGGTSMTQWNLSGDTAAPLVADDPGEALTVTMGGTQFESNHVWLSCCTDGFALGSLDDNWSLLGQFTAAPTGIANWQAVSSDFSSLPLAIVPGRRIRLDLGVTAVFEVDDGSCNSRPVADNSPSRFSIWATMAQSFTAPFSRVSFGFRLKGEVPSQAGKPVIYNLYEGEISPLILLASRTVQFPDTVLASGGCRSGQDAGFVEADFFGVELTVGQKYTIEVTVPSGDLPATESRTGIGVWTSLANPYPNGRFYFPLIAANPVSINNRFFVEHDMLFRVSGNSPAARLAALQTTVTGEGPGESFADKIMLAQTYLAVPDVQSTCAILSDFLNQVRAQRGKKLTIEIADQLTADAQAIMDAIGCN